MPSPTNDTGPRSRTGIRGGGRREAADNPATSHLLVHRRTISYFAPCDPRQGMGGGARLEMMIKALELSNWNIRLFAYRSGGPLALWTAVVSRATRMTLLEVPRGFPKILKLLGIVVLGIIATWRTPKHSIIFAHAPGIASGFVALIVSRVRRCNLVVDHMDAKDHETPASIFRMILSRADLVFVISRKLEGEVAAVRSGSTVFLPIFLDMTNFRRLGTQRESLRSTLGVSRSDFLLGYFGSFSRLEGVPILLEAVSRIIADGQSLKVLIVGGANVAGADDVERIVKQLGLEQNITIMPPQPHQQIPLLMGTADALVAPKIAAPENAVANPVKVYEYLASGVPCVTTRVGEVTNVITNGVTGFLANPSDPIDLERVLRYVIANPSARGSVGKAQRQLVEEEYSLDGAIRVIASAMELITSVPEKALSTRGTLREFDD